MTRHRRSGTALRIVVFVGLVALAALLLPVSAYVVEAISERAENWTLVVQLTLVTLIAAGVGVSVPGLSRAGASRGRRAAVWAATGLAAALVGNAIWLLMLAG